MGHDINKEQLTAFLDGELPSVEREAVEAHLVSCPECSAYLERVKKASSDFRQFGADKLPARLLATALALAADKKRAEDSHPALKLVLVLTAALALVLAGGLMAKHFLPGLFSQIQGMISGASAHLGQ
ncbi:MAG: zf-HC2 domain-containing protein [Elusimicrobia bacterium]|nr:zf-HC2 domain-containing protein [Elusimicrobiota bacterium]